ncbi:ATP-binding protein [Pseudomonas sp. GT1P32]
MVNHYLTPSEVAELYPDAALTSYATTDEAISAVQFGQADVYVGGGIGANYLIHKRRFNDLHLAAFVGTKQGGLGFVLNHKNTQLLRVVNRALDAVPLQERVAIVQRWKATPVTVHGRDKIALSPDEQLWLANNPSLKVAVLKGLPPVSFLDQNKKIRGVSADVLDVISGLVPLKFDLVFGHSKEELYSMVLRGEADVVVSTDARHPRLRFTRPYWSSPYVLVGPRDASVSGSLAELDGKRLALFRESQIVEYIRKYHPNTSLELLDSPNEVFGKVAAGKADVAITTLLGAQFWISNYYRDRLRIIDSVGDQSVQMSLGVSRGEPELYSILGKVLLSLPPDKIDEVTNRWFGNDVVERDYWQSHRWAIIQALAGALLLLAVAFYWVVSLRRLIDKRNAAESKLNEQVAFMRVLIDSLPHPILARDREGRLLLCNNQYLQALGGATYEQVIGNRLVDYEGISFQHALKLEQNYFDVMWSGESRIEDQYYLQEDGKTTTVYHWILPFRDSDAEVQGVIAGWIDISERERLLNDLKNTQLEAENANRAKTTFLATMSHEIRTPMNAIVGMLELAMKKADRGELDRFAIEVAFGAAQGLLGLIGDVLDVVRIESGHLALTPQRTAFKQLVESVMRMFEGLARQKYLDLVLEFDAQADRDLCVDPLRVKQVLSNLISNAIKFTQEGKVVVSVQAALTGDASTLKIQIHVRDTGIGISREDQERLFVPFSQVGDADQDQRNGSGLGLMISRTLCTMMQGELNLHSVQGIGTQVDVVLEVPVLEPLLPVDTEAAVDRCGKVLNVLVVDDYPANRLLLQQQLAYLGHNVSDEPDGAHGLKAWRNGRFDVVITDCNMPVMSGYELVRHIRAEEERYGAPPCLVLGFTANAQVDEVARCLAAGMDDCLFKPISMKALAVCLSSAEPIFVQATREEGVLPVLDGIDLTSLEQLTYGDRESIVHLLADLAKSNEEDMSRLVKLFSDGDFSAIVDLTHRIKGGARIIKAQRLIQCCEQVQQDCNDRNSVKSTQSVDALHQAMEALAQMMTTYVGKVENE